MKRYIKTSTNRINLESIKRVLYSMDGYDVVEMYESLIGENLTSNYDEDEDIEIIAEDIDFNTLAKAILQMKEDGTLESDNAYDLVNEVKFYI